MTEQETKKLTLSDCFWGAFSYELAVRGLHPAMNQQSRKLVAMRYGKRSLFWLPLHVLLRMGAMKAAEPLSAYVTTEKIDD